MLPELLRKHPVINRYKNIQSVGRGAFGHVFRGVDPETGQEVAIKMLMLGQTDEVLRRFSREAEALKKLKSPYLTDFIEMDFESDPPCLIMEWIAGGVLNKVTKTGEPAHPAQCRKVARDLLIGAHLLHERNMIHRDIKPANVFLREDGLAVLGDFGMVGGEVASTISRTGQALGTPKYMPPEVLKGLRWTPQGDLFAIGITLWEFATGVHPNTFFNHSLTMFLEPNLRLPTLEEAGAYRNPALQALVDALLEREPEDRPPDAPTASLILGEEAEAAVTDAEAIACYEPVGRDLDDEKVEEAADTHRAEQSRASRIDTQEQPRTMPGTPTDTRERTVAPVQRRTTHALPASRVVASPLAGAGPAPLPPPAALAPRVAAAVGLGVVLLLGAVQVGRGMLGGDGTALPQDPTQEVEVGRAFPDDYDPPTPSIRFVSKDLIELRWATPVKAFARGTARTPLGIEEFTRGPSKRPTRLNIRAPDVGAPFSRLSFVLEDREGGTVRAELPPSLLLHSLQETANQFLTATERGSSLEDRRRLWEPLSTLHAEGGIKDFDADLHHRLDSASSDL